MAQLEDPVFAALQMAKERSLEVHIVTYWGQQYKGRVESVDLGRLVLVDGASRLTMRVNSIEAVQMRK